MTSPNPTEAPPEEPPPDPEETGDDDGEGGEGDGETSTQFDPAAFEQRLLASLGSVVDSRINKFQNTLERNYGLKKSGSNPPSTEASGPDPQSTRWLRAAIRDAVATEFDDAEERKQAMALVKQFADGRTLQPGEDEDEVAAELVEVAKKWMGQAKDHYESAMRKDLEQRGLLQPDDPTQPKGGGSTKPKPGPSAVEQFRKGQEEANKRYGQKKE